MILAASGFGCTGNSPASAVLGGVEVSGSVLAAGKRVYRANCAPCHGVDGDGRGQAASVSFPPPRDFTAAKFKFAGVSDRGLPADGELVRIITGGLPGSSMPAWDLPDTELRDVIDYIKSFSPPGKGFRDPARRVSVPAIGPDPVGPEEREAAIAEGERLYHEVFECAKCHPSQGQRPPRASVPKWSETYKSILVPTDFGRHQMRSVRRDRDSRHNLRDLYRAIAFGLQGPMPATIHLGEANVWAVAHYVKSILDSTEPVP